MYPFEHLHLLDMQVLPVENISAHVRESSVTKLEPSAHEVIPSCPYYNKMIFVY